MLSENLYLYIVFHIEAKSKNSKENMKNKILNRLAQVLKCEKESIDLVYDERTNSYAYIQNNIKEKFEDKVIFLISTLQKFGHSYLVLGNLDERNFDMTTSHSSIIGVRFIQGNLSLI